MRNGDVTSAGPDRGQGRPGRRRGRSEAVVATGLGVLFALAAGLQLFWGQDVGLADNGDGFRLMCHFGLLKTVDVIANPLVLQ
ncbi:MAG: hypothetical protein M3N37_07320, partial [Actinomycetota bacterium]|nr:hypothetical protein [Actinomycetota bacterium]